MLVFSSMGSSSPLIAESAGGKRTPSARPCSVWYAWPGPREEAMKSPDFDYEKEIPAGFYDNIHHRKAGVRYCWHDLKFRTVAAHLTRAQRLLYIRCRPAPFTGNYLAVIAGLGTDLSAARIPD